MLSHCLLNSEAYEKYFRKRVHFNKIMLIALVTLKKDKKLILDKYMFVMVSKLFCILVKGFTQNSRILFLQFF